MPRTKTPARKKGMLKGISFDEVSFVGVGANQCANVSIIKMEDPEEVAKGFFSDFLGEMIAEQERDRFISDIYLVNDALRRSVSKIIWSDTITNKKQAIIEELQQFIPAFTSTVNDTDVIKMLTDVQNSIDGEEDQNQQEVKTVEKGIEFYKAQAMMNDEQKEIFKGMSEDEQAEVLKAAAKDKEALAAHFKDMAEKKKGKMKKGDVSKGSDETFQMEDGTVVAKSIVGDAAFLMLKGMSSRLEKAESETAQAQKIAKEERDQRILKEMAEEAEKLWPNLPGTALEKGKTLQAIRQMPEDVQKVQMEMLNSGNASNSRLFKENGHDHGAIGSATEKLNKMAKDHAAATGLTFHKAYSAVIDTPEGKKLYEEALN